MERMLERDFRELDAYIWGAISAATLLFFYLTLRRDVEGPILYNIALPEEAEPGWKGQVLDEPALKVHLPHAFSSISADCF